MISVNNLNTDSENLKSAEGNDSFKDGASIDGEKRYNLRRRNSAQKSLEITTDDLYLEKDNYIDDDVSRKYSKSDAGEEESYNFVYHLQEFLLSKWKDHRASIIRLILLVLLVGYSVYFGFAIAHDFEWSIALIVLTSLVVTYRAYAFLRDNYGDVIYENLLKPISDFFSDNWHVLKWLLYPGLIIICILYIGLDVIKEVRQLQSLTGFLFFFLLMFLTSKHPNKVYWRPVAWGLSLQFIMAILVLRWEYGYIAVKWLAGEITKFYMFGFEGAAVVFGDPFLLLHPFAMMGMPLLIYIGSVMALFYHLGITQWVVVKMGWLMQVTMRTTAIESLNTTANIFMSGMDTMMMLRHYLDKLTVSELNCFLVADHATVAGFVFALFVLFGAPPQHLLSAAVMSAPATIAICKLNYPETEESITKDLTQIHLTARDDGNVFEAAVRGASDAAKTVATVLACYITFMSILALINATLSWFGTGVGHPELSFELICSYVMWPIAWLVGIDYSECQEAAKLIGIKLFATELLAYQELGVSASKGRLNARNQAITTYAMCGFSSISTLAIGVGVWNSICPQRVKLMASLIFRALVQANISCFMTACVAGLFYSEELVAKLDTVDAPPIAGFISYLLGLIPSYSELMSLVSL